MKQDADRLELEALRLANRAARSIAQLESHRKSLVKEHAERIKRLRQIIESIQQREQLGTLGLEDAVVLSESAATLVHNPLEGL